MALTLQAIKYMIWLQVIAAGLALILRMIATDDNLLFRAATAAITAGILYLFLMALRREYVWAAVLFVAFCIVDFFGAIAGGVSLMNLLSLADAVLSFVAICGIVIWFREGKPPTNSDP